MNSSTVPTIASASRCPRSGSTGSRVSSATVLRASSASGSVPAARSASVSSVWRTAVPTTAASRSSTASRPSRV